MGFVRLYLALSVVVWHICGRALPFTVNGYVAVILFFIISGFYMSLVLNDKYRQAPVWRFYLARAMRLYPAYWVVLVLATFLAVVSASGGPWPTSALGWLLAVASNIAIFGINFGSTTALIPPAWSLALELQFYVFAPFIVARDIRIVAAVLALALACRFAFLGADFESWRYGFAPTDLCFFLLGAVSHRLGQLIDAPRFCRNAGIFAAIVLPALVIACNLVSVRDLDQSTLWIFYIAFAGALPFLFALSKDSSIDRIVGELSYPLYVCHWTVVAATVYFWRGAIPGNYMPAVAFAMVLIVAMTLTALIEAPAERFRQRFNRKAAAGSTA
jgi:peptidoglycan/LPS O-acetylase OafA/YrhL